MVRIKHESASEHSPDAEDSHGVRRRVVKACQRCRLKKCKCDGSTPCTRCKSDDAICTYGRHKKSDKIIFRKGYVQMLERQHTQLIDGLQELYRRCQSGQGWDGVSLDEVNYGQPLTHKILEGLGVLKPDEWDDSEGPDGVPYWHHLEPHRRHGCGRAGVLQQQQQQQQWSSESATASPSTTSHTTSPLSSTTTMPLFPQSTIMQKRREKHEAALTSMPAIGRTMATAPLPAIPPYSESKAPPLTNGFGYGFEGGNTGFASELHFQNLPALGAYGGAQQGSATEEALGYGNIEWGLGMDDVLDLQGGQGGWPLQAMG